MVLFFLQCYYFDDLFLTPFRYLRVLLKKHRDRHNRELQKNIEKRRIQEAYRQPFGVEYTQRYGRNIGWFIFATAFEKLSYPTF